MTGKKRHDALTKRLACRGDAQSQPFLVVKPTPDIGQ